MEDIIKQKGCQIFRVASCGFIGFVEFVGLIRRRTSPHEADKVIIPRPLGR